MNNEFQLFEDKFDLCFTFIFTFLYLLFAILASEFDNLFSFIIHIILIVWIKGYLFFDLIWLIFD